MADFYGNVAGADIYHADRLNTAWAGDNAAKAAALVRASQYLDAFYIWNTATADAIASDDVPLRIEQATYEAALRELVSPGSLTPDYVATGQITSETKQVGPLMKKLDYAKPMGPGSVRPHIALIDGMLRGLISGGAGAINFAVNR